MKKWFKKIGIALGRKKNTSDQKIEKKIKSFDSTISNTAETAKTEEAKPAEAAKTKEAPPEKIEIKPIIAKEAPPEKTEIKPIIAKEAPPEKIEIKPIIAKEAPPEKTETETEHENIKKSWFNKLGVNFKKTSSSIKEAIFSKRLDENFIANIEDAFLLSDLGVSYTNLLIDELKKKKFDDKNIKNQISNFLLSQFSEINHDLDLKSEQKLKVLLFFGVNGSGKTTTIAKLANKAKQQKIKVLIAAADTFRAAATEQIKLWGDRINVEVVTGAPNEDPSSVVFKAHKKGIDEKFDLLIIDTAGRLHNKIELMEELKKMVRIIKKNDETAPHNKILILDSTIGQNTYNQIDSFHQYIGITGVIMTKLDGSAKGGSLIGITKKYKMPINGIGIGEGLDDLIPFIPKEFINALLGESIGG